MVAPPPILSVILPTYNRRSIVSRCIDSILAQDFENFELLIVDDGSTDGTNELLKNYTDSRISVFQKENGGVSSARNLGIRNANGRYITFIDSDDYILSGFFSDAINVLEHDGLDALFYGGIEEQRWMKRKVPTFWGRNDEMSKNYQNYKLFEDFCLFGGVSWGCAKFFKSELIEQHKILFDEAITYGEDLIFILEFLLLAPRVGMRNEIFYYCDARGESLCRGQVNRNKKIEGLLLGYDKICHMLSESLKQDLIFFLNTSIIRHLNGVYYRPGFVMKNGEWKSRFVEVCSTPNQKMYRDQKLKIQCYKLPPLMGIFVISTIRCSLHCFALIRNITMRPTTRVARKVFHKTIRKKLRQWRGKKQK